MFLHALPKTEAECPPGTNIYDDSCVLEGSGFAFDMDEWEKAVRKTQEEYNKTREKQLNPGINPMLILAAAAAAFFIGG